MTHVIVYFLLAQGVSFVGNIADKQHLWKTLCKTNQKTRGSGLPAI
jgi:hypothetical protein